MVDWYVIGILTVMVIVNTIASVACWIELRAMQKSTHSIQMVPADTANDFQKITDELRQELTKDEFGGVG